MDLLPSREQEEIISSPPFLAATVPIQRMRELIDDPSRRRDRLVGGGGARLVRARTARGCGGVGCGLADEALVFRELGRALAPGPFVSTTLAARVAASGVTPSWPRPCSRAAGRPRSARCGADGAASGAVDGAFGSSTRLDADACRWRARVASWCGRRPQGCRIGRVHRPDDPTVAGNGSTCPADGERQCGCRPGVPARCRARRRITDRDRRGHSRHQRRHAASRSSSTSQSASTRRSSTRAPTWPYKRNWPRPRRCSGARHRRTQARRRVPHAQRQAHGDRGGQSHAAATIQMLGRMGFTFEHDANLYMKRAHWFSTSRSAVPTSTFRRSPLGIRERPRTGRWSRCTGRASTTRTGWRRRPPARSPASRQSCRGSTLRACSSSATRRACPPARP